MSKLTVRSTEVVSEIVDGEAVIVDLASGSYFSTIGFGAALWAQLIAGCELDELCTWAQQSYPSAASAIADTTAFVERLQAHDLLEVAASTPSETAAAATEDFPLPDEYSAPTVDVFKDMESLLLLDPIHDVEPDKGWPNT